MKRYIDLYVAGSRYLNFTTREDTKISVSTQGYESGKSHSVVEFTAHNDEEISIILSRNETMIIREIE